MSNSLLVVVPALNEADSLATILKPLVEHLESIENLRYRIIVLNDGSTDQTEKITKNQDIECISFPFNLGIAQMFNFAIRLAERIGVESLLIFDGDGQHTPHSVRKMLSVSGDNCVVIGTRNFDKYKIGVVRFTAIKIIRFVLFRKHKRKFLDPTSGFRIYSKETFPILSKYNNWTTYLDDTVLSLDALLNQNFKVLECEVEMNVRFKGEASSRGFNLAVNYLATIIKLVIQK